MEDKPRRHDRFLHQKLIALRIKINVPPSQFLMLFVVVLYLYQISYSPKLKLNSITWPNWITRCTKNQKSNYTILIFSESFNVRTKQVFHLNRHFVVKKRRCLLLPSIPSNRSLEQNVHFLLRWSTGHRTRLSSTTSISLSWRYQHESTRKWAKKLF